VEHLEVVGDHALERFDVAAVEKGREQGGIRGADLVGELLGGCGAGRLRGQ
jgi:hypothetical protein